jgi:hypothetical protein
MTAALRKYSRYCPTHDDGINGKHACDVVMTWNGKALASTEIHAAAPAAVTGCPRYHFDETLTLRGRVIQVRYSAEQAEGGKAYTTMALVLDKPICREQFELPDAVVHTLAVSPVSKRWLGHYVSVTGKMDTSGDGDWLSASKICDYGAPCKTPTPFQKGIRDYHSGLCFRARPYLDGPEDKNDQWIKGYDDAQGKASIKEIRKHDAGCFPGRA